MSGGLYNEIEPFAADWIGNLVEAGHIAPGIVDRRSISDIAPDDVRGRPFHAFAGVGVWSLALRSAGVSDSVPIWTGSCPCQPFSAAGSRRGFDDPRHLWPEWFRLIRECRPPLIFGEQVASKDGLAWVDAVQADLEGAGYAFAAFDLCAAGVGAPHIRQRLYFVAYTDAPGFGVEWLDRLRAERNASQRDDAHRRGEAGRMGDGSGVGDADGQPSRRAGRTLPAEEGGTRRRVRCEPDGSGDASADRGGSVEHADESRPQGRGERRDGADERPTRAPSLDGCATRGFWRECDWIPCADSQRGIVWRPVEPGTFPLAHGAAGRVGRLRAYGNAIVAPLAATFVQEAIHAISATKER